MRINEESMKAGMKKEGFGNTKNRYGYSNSGKDQDGELCRPVRSHSCHVQLRRVRLGSREFGADGRCQFIEPF